MGENVYLHYIYNELYKIPHFSCFLDAVGGECLRHDTTPTADLSSVPDFQEEMNDNILQIKIKLSNISINTVNQYALF